MPAWSSNSFGRSTARRRRPPAHPIAEVVAATPVSVMTLQLAVKQERRVSEQPVIVEIGQVDSLGVEGLYDVRFTPERVYLRDGGAAHLDETFVDGPAKESGDRWRGTITWLDASEGALTLRVHGEVRPQPGDRFEASPFPFLAALDQWAAGLDELPAHFLKMNGAKNFAAFAEPRHEMGSPPQGMRPAQARAFAAGGRRASIVWGPPGTGKTRTMAEIAAAHVAAGRTVLAVSTSNAAVDVLLLAIDDACRARALQLPAGALIRAGRPQDRRLSEDPERKHLLRWTETLDAFARKLGELADEQRVVAGQLRAAPASALEKRKALRVRAVELERRRKDLEAERSIVLARLALEARCVATTTMSFAHSAAVSGRDYDVALIDEASMVPAAVLCRLAGGRIDAWCMGGDVMQLPPVTKGSNETGVARAWFGWSALDAAGLRDPRARATLQEQGSLVLLEEQFRMAPEICAVVSDTFYEGRLKTCGTPPSPPRLSQWPVEPLVLVPPAECAPPPGSGELTASPQKAAHGAIWDRSAAVARALVEALLADRTFAGNVLVASPYAAQARLLSKTIAALRSRRVRAGTIHRMQGSEADVVVFDPVEPNGWFLTRSEDALRLVNVALSRARAQVFVLCSREELVAHPWLARFADAATEWVPNWPIAPDR